jgi:hypothetical protein
MRDVKKYRTHTRRSYEECVKMYSKGLKRRQHVGALDVSQRIIKFLVTVYRLMTRERPTRKKLLVTSGSRLPACRNSQVHTHSEYPICHKALHKHLNVLNGSCQGKIRGSLGSVSEDSIILWCCNVAMLTTISNDGTAFIFREKQSKNSHLGLPDPAAEVITITINVCSYLPVDAVYYPKRLESSLCSKNVKIIRELAALTVSNPIFLLTAYSPALICFGR